MKSFMFSVLFIISANVSGLAFADQGPLETVNYVDLNRYLGTWYEIARLDHSFQRGCVASSATYSLRDDGDIKVVNRCRQGTVQGPLKEAVGRAWVVDTASNAKLKVQFFLSRFRIGFLSGNYWITELDEDNYSYAVVGDPSRKYLWVLSREKTMNEQLYQAIIGRAKEKGFPTESLIRSPQ